MPDDRELTSTRASGRLLRTRSRARRDRRAGGVAPERGARTPTTSCSRKPLGLLFWLAMGWVGLVVVLAIMANLLPLPSPNFQNYSAINASPSIHHLLGTDDLGRDLLSRLIYGSRVSLVVGFVSVAIGMAGGRHPGPGLGIQGRSPRPRAQCRLVRAAGLPGHRGRHRHRGLLGLDRSSRSPSSSGWPSSLSCTAWCGPPACRSPTASSWWRPAPWGPTPLASCSGRSSPTWSRWPSPSPSSPWPG